MARIEISIEEYNSYKEKINLLESKVSKLTDELIESNDVVNTLEGTINYLTNETTVLDRIFRWKSISQTILEEIEKDKEIIHNDEVLNEIIHNDYS